MLDIVLNDLAGVDDVSMHSINNSAHFFLRIIPIPNCDQDTRGFINRVFIS